MKNDIEKMLACILFAMVLGFIGKRIYQKLPDLPVENIQITPKYWLLAGV